MSIYLPYKTLMPLMGRTNFWYRNMSLIESCVHRTAPTDIWGQIEDIIDAARWTPSRATESSTGVICWTRSSLDAYWLNSWKFEALPVLRSQWECHRWAQRQKLHRNGFYCKLRYVTFGYIQVACWLHKITLNILMTWSGWHWVSAKQCRFWYKYS